MERSRTLPFPMPFRIASLSLLLLLTFLTAAVRAQDVRLTEFQATNVTGIVDEDGTRQGWIEVWNPSTTTAVVLTGWKLTNGATTWTFPAVNINPDEFMIVWASAKNRTVVTAPLHTSFTIPAGGGTLSLLRSNNGVASSLASYPAQTADTSWGRDERDAATTPTQVGRYTSPTPGGRNSFSGSGVSGTVIFDKPSQSFTGTLVLTISQTVPDASAVIRYTLDGSVPTATSTTYAAPLNVMATQMIRARIYKSGLLPGETETQCFLLRDATTTAFSSAMPIIVVSNFGLGQPPDVGDQNGFVWVWEPTVPDNRSRLTNLPALTSRIVIDRRGSSTLNNPKYNINMEVRRARDDDDRNVALLGMADGSDWVFSGPYEYDRSEIHNPLMYALSNRIGRYAPAVRLAEVFMKVTTSALNFSGTGNDYYGIYNVVEKIRRDKNRVDVHKLDTYDNDAVGKTGGFIWKIDRRDAGDSGFAAGGYTGLGTGSLGPSYYYPKEIHLFTPQRDPQEQYLTSYVNAFYTALQSATWNNPTTGYAAYLDVPEAIDHHLLNVWPMNVDGMRLSGYWHKERGGKLIPGPIWDFDRTMYCATDTRTDNPSSWRSTVSDFGTDFFNYIWWDRLFADIEFYQKYIDRWQALRRGAFSQANVNALLDSLNAQMSAEAINRDVARWAKGKRAWNALPASQDAEVQRIKDWLQQRATFMDSQWVGPVSASLAEGNVASGTQLTLTGPAGATIFYTLNGADPRPNGGGAPSGVLTYTGTPITVNATTRIRARAYNAAWTALTGANNPSLVSKWSGLTNVRYSTDTPATAGNLVVTEINYHPPNPTAAELLVNPVFTSSDFEFIELRNIGTTTIDLGGAQFTFGIIFSFTGDAAMTLAPDAHVVVAANPSAFAARNGAGATVVGPFLGDLDNSGEQITLKAATNATILDFTYDDAWYPTTDGGGRTLVIYDPYGAPATFRTAQNWRASAASKGSPGAAEPNLAPTAFAGADVSGLVSGVSLAGTVTDDSQPNPPRAVTVSWSQNGGPGAVAFTPPDAASTSATFPLPGIYVLRFTANDTLLSAFSDVLVFAKDTPTAWLARHPGIGTLNDDFDHDGWNNFAEFGLGLDPNIPDVGSGPVAVLENGHLTITYSRIKPASAVIYTIEVADNITAFRPPNPGEVTEEILADSGITQTVKAVDSVSTSGPPSRFMRLKVSATP